MSQTNKTIELLRKRPNQAVSLAAPMAPPKPTPISEPVAVPVSEMIPSHLREDSKQLVANLSTQIAGEVGKENSFNDMGVKMIDEAFKRNQEAGVISFSLFWDKVFFNYEMPQTRYLCNEFDGYPFFIGTREFPTRLHYYYAKFTMHKEDRERLLAMADCNKMREFFKTVEKKDEWESLSLRRRVMSQACEAQVSQNPNLKMQLKKTGDYTSIIFLNFNDGFFGVGKDGRGMNHLGQILMECRRLLTDKENDGSNIEIDPNFVMVQPDQKFTDMIGNAMGYICGQFKHMKGEMIPGFEKDGGIFQSLHVLDMVSKVQGNFKESSNSKGLVSSKEDRKSWIDARRDNLDPDKKKESMKDKISKIATARKMMMHHMQEDNERD